ncbi:hypothetical protein [Massilia sp.]|uniref:hypothetical protein n=1 Tax=Massilia sp. TaxID=1882437 RepID=UPI00289DE8C1|nr:hypothetical protein [Massilia sp.]
MYLPVPLPSPEQSRLRMSFWCWRSMQACAGLCLHRWLGLRFAAAFLGMGLALLAPAYVHAQAGSAKLSQAETLLFETDHLARIEAPAVLVYEFRKVSNVEPGFSDKVRLDVNGSKGKLSATLHFLSGKNRHDLPPLEEAHGNPVLLGFLERDIAEMKRLTGGSTAYFRKRLRMALAESAEVRTQSITYQGKTLQAQSVRIQPYLDDPMHARFEQYVNKTYTFIVSDGMPGGVYQLRSSLANRDRQQPGTTVAGSGEGGAAPEPAVARRASQERPAAASPAPATTAAAATLPEIEETLTLVSVASQPADDKAKRETGRKN